MSELLFLEQFQQTSSMQSYRGGMVVLCLAITFLTVAIRSSINNEDISLSQILYRCGFAILGIMAAAKIQNYLWQAGQGLADQMLPGSSLADLVGVFEQKVATIKSQRDAIAPDGGSWWAQNISFPLLNCIEQAALTIFYFTYKWFISVQYVVMTLLAAMAPMMISTSMIPGAKGFGNWLKMVICVALWPVIATFFLKSHLLSAAGYIGSSDVTIFTGDASNLFLNMNALQLMLEALLFGFFIFVTPLIASGIVYGSAAAFSMGSSFLMAAGPLTAFTVQGKAAQQAFNFGGGAVRMGYNAYPLLKQPHQAPRLISQEIQRSLSRQAKFRHSSGGFHDRA